MPRLVMVAPGGPIPAKLPVGIMSSETLCRADALSDRFAAYEAAQNTAFRRRTSDRFQNRRHNGHRYRGLSSPGSWRARTVAVEPA